MDGALCDELIEEIFLRLPPPSSAAVSLVSKRWLRLHRSSKTHLSLVLSPTAHTPFLLSEFLSRFPFLASLSLSLSSSDHSLLLSAAASCPSLRHLRLVCGPLSSSALASLSSYCPRLVSLSVSLSRPFSLRFLSLFPSLKDLSLTFALNDSGLQNPNFNSNQECPRFDPTQFNSNFENPHFHSGLPNPNLNSPQFNSNFRTPNFNSNQESPRFDPTQFNSNFENPHFHSGLPNPNLNSPQFITNFVNPNFNLGPESPNSYYSRFDPTRLDSNLKPTSFGIELQLETLTLSCIKNGDYDLDWLYKSCKKLKMLKFRACESIGDNPSSSSFIDCIRSIQEVELRTCRMIIDKVLIKLADNCKLLKSLLIYDGGCRESLLRFIERSKCDLQKLDLRLPLDLDNRHLSAVANKFIGLNSLKLQSCGLFTVEGLKSICSNGLEELSLINCDVAERESGLLANLGQNLKNLKKLDLSYNETLVDKEFISMIVSCGDVRELKLKGCRGLSNLSLISISKYCKNLEYIDIMYCCGITGKDVELFVSNSSKLRHLKVEESKISDDIKIRGPKLIF